MFQYQTLACLHDIPVVRSSTDIIQQMYTKAKDSSAFIRVPVNAAEYVADKSLKIAATVTNPFTKPFRGSVEVIDNYAAKQIRFFESKYPAIVTPTEDVVNTFSAKTETVRNAVSSVKKSTTDTIQHGKETVTNVASATVNKATGVADTIYAFCEARVPRLQNGKYFDKKGFSGCLSSKSNGALNEILRLIQTSLSWCRLVMFIFLLKIKQINDVLLTMIGKKATPLAVVQQILIKFNVFLEQLAGYIRPDERSMNNLQRSGKSKGLYPSRDLSGKSINAKDELHRRIGAKVASDADEESNSELVNDGNKKNDLADNQTTTQDSDDE